MIPFDTLIVNSFLNSVQRTNYPPIISSFFVIVTYNSTIKLVCLEQIHHGALFGVEDVGDSGSLAEEADVRHPGDIGGGAGAGDEGRKGADVEDEVRYGVGFFDFILLAGGKVQAPCAVIFRDDIVFNTEGDLPCAAASTVF